MRATTPDVAATLARRWSPTALVVAADVSRREVRVIEAVRAVVPEVYVVVTSRYGQERTAAIAAELGADAWWERPTSLAAAAAAIMARRRGALA